MLSEILSFVLEEWKDYILGSRQLTHRNLAQHKVRGCLLTG